MFRTGSKRGFCAILFIFIWAFLLHGPAISQTPTTSGCTTAKNILIVNGLSQFVSGKDDRKWRNLVVDTANEIAKGSPAKVANREYVEIAVCSLVRSYVVNASILAIRADIVGLGNFGTPANEVTRLLAVNVVNTYLRLALSAASAIDDARTVSAVKTGVNRLWNAVEKFSDRHNSSDIVSITSPTSESVIYRIIIKEVSGLRVMEVLNNNNRIELSETDIDFIEADSGLGRVELLLDESVFFKYRGFFLDLARDYGIKLQIRSLPHFELRFQNAKKAIVIDFHRFDETSLKRFISTTLNNFEYTKTRIDTEASEYRKPALERLADAVLGDSENELPRDLFDTPFYRSKGGPGGYALLRASPTKVFHGALFPGWKQCEVRSPVSFYDLSKQPIDRPLAPVGAALKVELIYPVRLSDSGRPIGDIWGGTYASNGRPMLVKVWSMIDGKYVENLRCRYRKY